MSDFDRAGRVIRRITLHVAGPRKSIRAADFLSRNTCYPNFAVTRGILSFQQSGGQSTSPNFFFVIVRRLLCQSLAWCGNRAIDATFMQINPIRTIWLRATRQWTASHARRARLLGASL
jgi:hypothetical protein